MHLRAIRFCLVITMLAIASLSPLDFPSTLARAQSTIACDPAAISQPVDVLSAPPTDTTVTPFPDNPGEVTVFAASSLTDALGQIERDLEAVHAGLDLVINFGGSQALATQLAEGAEADLFISADALQMQRTIDADVVAAVPVVIATNRLAIVVPSDNPAGISTPADLAGDGVQLVIAAESVPAGVYAREAICLMGMDTAGYGDNFEERVAGNIVSNETNVRSVLAKVMLGEADAGIVYASDASAESTGAISTIEIPESVNRSTVYPAAAINGGTTANADALISYLLGPDGQSSLASFGFGSPWPLPIATPESGVRPGT